jgi:hypothetical protein
MGVFGIDTFRERSLIPPDPPEPEPIVERGQYLDRITFEGEASWKAHNQYLSDADQDAYEDAYELGRRSMAEQVKLLKAALASVIKERDDLRAFAGQAWGAGVVVAAQAAYGGKGR